ncbi:MAG: AAA family ATPase [Candidatus Pristimantibacillus lignocellulolyticus]|uniref:AAA family ATPase n=1 Tax=Candidatus Pristimantibacillus lignocellulolyticus TaxID=2994561 RepID=A0A9J6ZKU0_9BACL|nr:MAG: AAA family ATPase [Candidatus Pristimantibacillus lignocellulolyticus]
MKQITQLQEEIGKVIVGQKQVVEQLIWCVIAGGHALLEGIPGLGKTMLVRTLSDVLSLQFSRIQFTPDLMPADITGTTLIDFGSQGITSQRFGKGPIFGNLVLADEINRATPKTQSALLEAMQEGTVTAGGESYALPKPFFVLATQNPIEQEGTYPLPEAQLDRFLLKIGIEYPNRDELKEIVRRTTGAKTPEAQVVMSGEQLQALQALAKQVVISEEMLDAAVSITMRTHRHEEDAPQEVKQFVRYGAGPRALQSLVSISRVRALSQGRAHVSWNDLIAVAAPVLRHRIGLSYEAQAQGMLGDHVVASVIASLEKDRR